jgi:hypothetical protein
MSSTTFDMRTPVTTVIDTPTDIDSLSSSTDLAPGALMAAEIRQQPQVWRRLLTEGTEQISAAADLIKRRRPRFRAVRRPRHQ